MKVITPNGSPFFLGIHSYRSFKVLKGQASAWPQVPPQWPSSILPSCWEAFAHSVIFAWLLSGTFLPSSWSTPAHLGPALINSPYVNFHGTIQFSLIAIVTCSCFIYLYNFWFSSGLKFCEGRNSPFWLLNPHPVPYLVCSWFPIIVVGKRNEQMKKKQGSFLRTWGPLRYSFCPGQWEKEKATGILAFSWGPPHTPAWAFLLIKSASKKCQGQPQGPKANPAVLRWRITLRLQYIMLFTYNIMRAHIMRKHFLDCNQPTRVHLFSTSLPP